MSNVNRMIEEQIRIELLKLESIHTTEDEKPAIIQRIAELKALIGPEAQTDSNPQPTVRELISDLISALRRR